MGRRAAAVGAAPAVVPAVAAAAADATRPPRPQLALDVVGALAAGKLALHLLTIIATPYGIHRDEFLYLAMGSYLDFWRMEFPPAIAVLANLARLLPGESLFEIRILPALAGTILLVLACVAAREFGGGRMAQALAGVAVLASPLFLRSASLFQPVVFDQLWWTLGLLALLRASVTGLPRWWLLLGAVAGLGLLTKFSILFFGAAVLVGLLLAPQRRALLTPWPYAAAAIALLIGSASVIGQLRLGWPVIGNMAALQETQLVRVGALDFLAGQLRLLGPAALLAAAGAWYLVRDSETRAARAVGWSCITAFVIMLLAGGKAYYIGPIYPVLLGAGAVACVRLQGRVGRALPAGALGVMIAAGAITLPMGLPLLPPEPMARYAAALGVTSAVTTNRGDVLPLPQDYADMLGWEEQVAAVAQVYHTLPPAERAQAVIVGRNYGEAGALDYYRARYGLPRAVSAAGTYWFFGPGELPGAVIVSLGNEPEDLAPFFAAAELVARVDVPWGVPEQRDNPIVVARQPVLTLQEAWPQLAGQQ